MYLIVGLGNPGEEYAATRHNLGFMVIDQLALRLSLPKPSLKHRSLLVKEKYGERTLILAKPQTFMNNSGEAVSEIANWYKIPPAKIIIAYDDVDLEPGQIRLRDKGSAGGHHGVESVIKHLGSSQFIRLRLGVGRPSLAGDVAEYVLAKIPPAERTVLEEAASRGAEAIETIIKFGLPAAMNKYNSL